VARILIGWELGGGNGHATALAALAARLRARGHEPVVVAQDVASMPAGLACWQAPLWPNQLVAYARPSPRQPATMGDILATMGLAKGDAVRALLAAWDRLLAAIAPDAVIAEFAPALALTARGRVPLVAHGTGFSLPPAELPAFPSLTGAPAVHDEGALLVTLNRALVGAGRPPLDALPRIFAADRSIVAAFREMDPYRPWRASHGAPTVAGRVPAGDGTGDELFVYMNGPRARPGALWRGLIESGLPVRVHDPMLAPAACDALERAGIAVERAPVPVARIVERSRLLLSHGGMGSASTALLAGLPHFVLPYDLEKEMTAANVLELGLGWRGDFGTMEAGPLAAALRAAYEDGALAARARAAAPGFRARMARGGEEETIDAIEALIA